MTSRNLGLSTVILAGVLAYTLTTNSGPGTQVSSSLAASLRGGDCYSTVTNYSCEDASGSFCDKDKTQGCVAGMFKGFSGTATTGSSPSGTTFCCGAAGGGCDAVTPQSATCGGQGG